MTYGGDSQGLQWGAETSELKLESLGGALRTQELKADFRLSCSLLGTQGLRQIRRMAEQRPC